MRNILAEQISKMQSIMGIQDELLLEASKVKILTDKEGLDQDQAIPEKRLLQFQLKEGSIDPIQLFIY